jgi:RimJ/RimL family protein N-acetyltransferase
MKLVRLTGRLVTIRTIEDHDIPILWKFIHDTKDPEWKKWDAPYFPLEHKTLEEFTRNLKQQLTSEPVPPRAVIEVNNTVIGTVSYNWEHKASKWLEVGIVIYDPSYWNGGYGTDALKLWIDYLFNEMPLVRIGLTTWSGNKRMIRCAEKVGMKMEGRIRKCRYWNGEWYDSIRMGLLREEWEQNQNPCPQKNWKLRLIWIVPNILFYIACFVLTIWVVANKDGLQEINRLSIYVFILLALFFVSVLSTSRIISWIKEGKM